MGRRRFTAALKAQAVLELVSGTKSMAQLTKEHGLKESVLLSWKEHFESQAARLFEVEDAERKADACRIAELERLVGKLSLELEIAKKASRMLAGMSRKNGRSPCS